MDKRRSDDEESLEDGAEDPLMTKVSGMKNSEHKARDGDLSTEEDMENLGDCKDLELTPQEKSALEKIRRLRARYQLNSKNEEEELEMLPKEEGQVSDDREPNTEMTSFIDQPYCRDKSPDNRTNQSENTLSAPLAAFDEDSFPETTTQNDVDQRQPGVNEIPIELHDVEMAPPSPQRENDLQCNEWGILNPIGTQLLRLREFVRGNRGKRTPAKVTLLILAMIGVMGFVVFLVFFPKSFVFVEYYEVALKKNKLTGTVDRETVYYSGCYILGPNVEFVSYDITAHRSDMKVGIFTSDKLSIAVDVHLQYFLKPEEVGKLHSKLEKEYESVFNTILLTCLKNTGIQYSLTDFRLSRNRIEREFHSAVQKRLSGDCCPDCCPKSCTNKTICRICNFRETCEPGYHTDVRYFHLGQVHIPHDVLERFTRQTILQIEGETEKFKQQHAVELKKTELESQQIVNEANIIKSNATALGQKTQDVAAADYEKTVQSAYVGALQGLYRRLNVSQEDHKLSLMMIREFEDNIDNIYSYNYQKLTGAAP